VPGPDIFSLATSFTVARSRPATAPCKTGRGARPHFIAVLFSSEHGLFSWTPLLLLATVGLVLFSGASRVSVLRCWLRRWPFIFLLPAIRIGRGYLRLEIVFFVSLTPLFILGLSVFLQRAAALFRSRRAAVTALSMALALFVMWNAEFMFQWGAHLIPPRGRISWNVMIRNQFQVVPRQIAVHLGDYLFHRHDMMRQIEDRDIDQLKKQSAP